MKQFNTESAKLPLIWRIPAYLIMACMLIVMLPIALWQGMSKVHEATKQKNDIHW